MSNDALIRVSHFLHGGAVIPVDVETTSLLVEALRAVCQSHDALSTDQQSLGAGVPLRSLSGEQTAAVASVPSCAQKPTIETIRHKQALLLEKACRAMNESGLGEHGCSQASELEPAVMAKLRSYNTDAEVFAFRDGWQAARAKSAERDWNEGFVKGHDLGNTVREIGEDLAAAHKRFGITATGPSKVVPNGWVSVEERLPEVNQQVLLVNVGNFKYGELRNHAFGCLTSWGGLPHYWSIPGEGIIGARSLKAFTHWMPFPAPPEALSAPDQSPEAPETDKRKPNDVELWKSYAQGRADEAEQREADARDAERWLVALKSIAANTCCGSCQEAKKVAMAALRATNHDS